MLEGQTKQEKPVTLVFQAGTAKNLRWTDSNLEEVEKLDGVGPVDNKPSND